MTEHPNVLFILSDQHRYCSLPGVDGCEVVAPNLERLQRAGTSFSSYYSNYPLCAPARGMLISGRWPSDTGVVNNLSELEPSPSSLGAVFSQGRVPDLLHRKVASARGASGNGRWKRPVYPAGPGPSWI